MREQPLGDARTGQYRLNTSTAISPSLLSDDDDDSNMIYPPIINVLREMDVAMPLLDMPQYEAVLVEHGIAYVNNAVGISDHWFTDVIHMPIGVIHSFFNVTRRLIRHARKGKERAVDTDSEMYYDPDEDKENYGSNMYGTLRRQQSTEV
jgi:hypothetical protein